MLKQKLMFFSFAVLLLVLPVSANAAISLDTSTVCTGVSNLGTCSITVGSGTNRILVLYYTYENTGATDPVFTCGGTIATLIVSSAANPQRVGLFYIVNPPSGSYTCTMTAAANSAAIVLASYAGAAQVSQPDNSRSASFTGTSLSQAITVNTTGSWVILTTQNTVSCSGEISSASNWTFRQQNSGCHSWQYGDSNASASAGSYTQSGTMATSQTYVVLQASIAPAASAAAVDNTFFYSYWW